MKAQVSVNVGDYNDTRLTRQCYELPSLDTLAAGGGPQNGALVDGRGMGGETTGGERRAEADCSIRHRPNEAAAAVEDSVPDRHYVHLVHIPRARCEGEERFSAENVISGYTERVTVASLAPGPQRSCASFCHYEVDPPRCKQVVTLAPTMTATAFRESLVLLRDCTRTRYRSALECWPRVRPVRHAETCYVQPRRLANCYVSYVDYNVDRSRQWHQAALQVTPRVVCDNLVAGFEFNDSEGSFTEGEEEYEGSDSEERGWAGSNGDVSVSVEGWGGEKGRLRVVENGEPVVRVKGIIINGQ